MIKPTTPEEIEDIISKIDTSKSTGPNSIPNQLLQALKSSITVPLSTMFNQSFLKGQCPNFIKLSTVIPIHKKDSKLTISNYQTIDQYPFFPILIIKKKL